MLWVKPLRTLCPRGAQGSNNELCSEERPAVSSVMVIDSPLGEGRSEGTDWATTTIMVTGGAGAVSVSGVVPPRGGGRCEPSAPRAGDTSRLLFEEVEKSPLEATQVAFAQVRHPGELRGEEVAEIPHPEI